jgi:ribosomal-protein-alanine N-acetyltransferase
MSNEIKIKPMDKGDIPQVVAVQNQCRLSPWTSGSYKIVLADPEYICYTAKINESVKGFTVARLITSEDSCELLNIGISPPQQGKRIGGRLISKLLKEIQQKADKVFLEVREGNARAIGFYKKHGFYQVGKRKNMYSDPVENALLMEKRLD